MLDPVIVNGDCSLRQKCVLNVYSGPCPNWVRNQSLLDSLRYNVVGRWTDHDCNEVCCLPRPSNRAPKSLRNLLSFNSDQFHDPALFNAFLQNFEKEKCLLSSKDLKSENLWMFEVQSTCCILARKRASNIRVTCSVQRIFARYPRKHFHIPLIAQDLV